VPAAEQRLLFHRELTPRFRTVLASAPGERLAWCDYRLEDDPPNLGRRTMGRSFRRIVGLGAGVMLATATAQAIEAMTRFADRTGVTGERPSRRYLWTDAFAVCNFLGLERATGEGRYRELALRLVDQVHHTLGRHRPDDTRTGWLSGLNEREGEAHPTRGGLRIGKPLPERGPGQPPDDRLEWDRDGQYFHYLTKWMHALDQVARATGQPIFNAWARELAGAAYRAFTYRPQSGVRQRMYWKMMIDLSRPLVASMGQHDPLDGFVTYSELEATGRAMDGPASGPRLTQATADFAAMMDPGALATADPLGLGGLLVDAFLIEQLIEGGALGKRDELVPALFEAALVGLRQYVQQPDLRSPADRRLAFRELGLAIGLAAVGLMGRNGQRVSERFAPGSEVATRLASLTRYMPLREEIESFWVKPEHRRAGTWLEHEDINEVTLATSLAPEGFLLIRLRPGAQPGSP
jgi:hypothetical protein